MAVKIRFARIGKKHAPVYRIIAVDSRKKRDGKCLENLGTYNPLTKEIIQFHDDRVAYWVSVGAVVADSVERLIKIRKKQQAAQSPKPEVKPADKKEASVKKTTTKAKTESKPVEKKEVKKTAAPKKSTAKKTEETKK